MNIDDIARVAHEANRALCEIQGDRSQCVWAVAPTWQRESARHSVLHAKNPEAGPEDSHKIWLAEKKADGWVFGADKDSVLKTHPCMLPYDHLPPEQQIRDTLFLAVARTLLRAAGLIP